MTSYFEDKFKRTPDDGAIGTNYTIPCGGAIVVDNESVVPIDATEVASGVSPLFGAGTTSLKTQVLYTGEDLDGPDQVIRIVWAHDPSDETVLPDVSSDPSVGILARMAKDPLLYDLGTAEDPACYDQGYGLRVTCPRTGAAPVLKLIKYLPSMRIPGVARPSSSEVDGMIVLTSVTLQDVDLNLDPSYDEDTDTLLPYRGFWQDMRLRIRRADNEVILDAYLNDRNMNQSILTYTDRQDPLWGGAGAPGFEFVGASLDSQPVGVSPFSLAGLSTMRVGLFAAATIKDIRRPVRVHPSNVYTYQEVTNRVITLVEKNGDARYNATTAGTTKFQTYLDFVHEAELNIIKAQGYWSWLRREQVIYLKDGVQDYEVPMDCGEIEMIRPSWNQPPLMALDPQFFHQRWGPANTQGRPVAFCVAGMGPDDRQIVRFFPIPQVADGAERSITISYHARAQRVRAADADVLMPLIPQDHIDVLVYGAAAHALLLNTDSEDAGRFSAVFASKLSLLRRADNRSRPQQTIARSAGDVLHPDVQNTRYPIYRGDQLL